MKRILIIGSPGSGKTTLARQLSAALSLPCIHLDRLFWESGWQMRPKEVFYKEMRDALLKEEWIIDGNYGGSISERASFADTVIFLDYPRILCLWRVLKRTVRNLGKTRTDMGENCPDRFDLSFLWYVWVYPRRERQKMLSALAEYPSLSVIHIKTQKEFSEFTKKYFKKGR